MKKLVFIIFVLALALAIVGCSNLPGNDAISEKETAKSVDQLFDYSNTDNKPGEILIKTRVSLEGILAKEGSKIIKEWPELDWILVELPQGEEIIDFINKVRKFEGVLIAEPNMGYELHKAPPESVENYNKQWGFENINAEAAWDITTGSSDVIVAIIDTGVDINHPEFEGNLIDSYDATGEGYDGANMYDINGHGTHVAGIAAANGNSGQIAGVAWDSPIMPIRVGNDDGQIFTEYLIDAMIYLGEYAANNSERIVANMSIGGRGYSFAFKDAIDYAAEEGVLLVTSAGNDEKRVLNYPSAYNGVVSVAASDPYDRKVDFSSVGYWNSVAAPGIKILSTYPSEYSEDGYEFLQGTSMASPFVTGAAALLLSEYPELTPLEIKNQIEQTANGRDYTEELGYGILDIEAMLGPIMSMQYGSVEVSTNIDTDSDYVGLGVVTIHDSNGLLISHGTTGYDGKHIFSALKPGEYTVNTSFYRQVQSESVSVAVDSPVSLDFQFGLPEEVLIDKVEINTAESFYEKSYNLEAGYYSIYTEENTEPFADTVLYLYDSNGNLIAGNNDYNDLYSRIDMYLESGEYVVYVEEYNGSPLNCMLYVTKTEF